MVFQCCVRCADRASDDCGGACEAVVAEAEARLSLKDQQFHELVLMKRDAEARLAVVERNYQTLKESDKADNDVDHRRIAELEEKLAAAERAEAWADARKLSWQSIVDDHVGQIKELEAEKLDLERQRDDARTQRDAWETKYASGEGSAVYVKRIKELEAEKLRLVRRATLSEECAACGKWLK